MSARQNAPIPVLITVRELNLGGIERDAAKLAMHMDRRRFIPHIGSFHDSGFRYEELKQNGIPVLSLPVRSLRAPATAKAALRLWRYIRKHRIRVVHSMDASAVFFTPLARAFGVPAVLSSMLGSRALLDAKTLKQYRWTDRLVDTVVVNCEAMREHMIEEGVPPGRIELCYNGVDTQQFYPGEAARPDSVAGASLVIGAVCALRPEKALHLLQEAFALVRDSHPGIKLLIVGDGPERARLIENAERLNLGDGCVFHPATRDVAAILRGIDIFVLCSVSEAFSNALLEAMACGCCVVGSRTGGTPEMIGSEEQRGLLFESGNVAELASRLRTLIEDSSLRRNLGCRAAEWAHATLSIEANVARTAEIYEAVLRRKTP